MECEPFELAGFMENFRMPAVFFCHGFDFAENGVDVNRFAVVAAEVFAEFLHARSFS